MKTIIFYLCISFVSNKGKTTQFICSSLVSDAIAMTKLGRKGLLHLTNYSPMLKEVRTGTQERLRQVSQSKAVTWFAH